MALLFPLAGFWVKNILGGKTTSNTKLKNNKQIICEGICQNNKHTQQKLMNYLWLLSFQLLIFVLSQTFLSSTF